MREVEILKKKQLKCYLYTRVSTSMQVDGYSLDAQRDKLRKYAAYEDMIVAGEYSDEGFSGKNIQGRQEFQRMLNDIQDGKDEDVYKRQSRSSSSPLPSGRLISSRIRDTLPQSNCSLAAFRSWQDII